MRKAFTLIELMVVVAIIAILAAIAIPQYRQFQLKSKTSEAKMNLGAIKSCEEAYAAENDHYRTANATPSGNPGPAKRSWSGTGTGFDDIGFEPAGNVYYQYGVQTSDWTDPSTAPGQTPANVTARSGSVDIYMCARGDLDGDGTYAGFKMNDENTTIASVGTPGEF
ncbi:type IV pilin protein [Desulfurobacterium sp.]